MRSFPDKELSRVEKKLFRSLSTPAKIQNYLNTIRINVAETCYSPRQVLKRRTAHCLEGAIFAAAVLWSHGERPLLLDLRSATNDDDHVVALYQRHQHWGALSQTNHAVLRYREPVYWTVRELAMSYFHEYFLDNGKKTLLSYSTPLDLRRFRTKHWMTAENDLWYIATALDDQPHHLIGPKAA